MKILRKIIKNTVIAYIPISILSTITVNSSPLKKSLSSPNLSPNDMFNESFRKYIDFGLPIVNYKFSTSIPDLNNQDKFQDLRHNLMLSNNLNAMQNGAFPRPMVKIFTDGDFFMDIYYGLKMPKVNNNAISTMTKAQYIWNE